MIVPDDQREEAKDAGISQQESGHKFTDSKFLEFLVQEAPPPYVASTSTQPLPASKRKKKKKIQVIIPPAFNFVSVIRQDQSIRENFPIDPYIPVNPCMLPPLEEGLTERDRENLKLQTRDGVIDVQVWLVSNIPKDTRAPVRTTAVIGSRDGSVTARIVRIQILYY